MEQTKNRQLWKEHNVLPMWKVEYTAYNEYEDLTETGFVHLRAIDEPTARSVALWRLKACCPDSSITIDAGGVQKLPKL